MDGIPSSLVAAVACAAAAGKNPWLPLGLVFLGSGWPRPLAYVLFFVLGATAVGWNGVFHAEAARLSPPGMASLVAGGTTFFVFGGVLVGPSLFAYAYGITGSYATTFGLLTVASAIALLFLGMARGVNRGHG